MPEIGQTISHYRISEKLGQGGMGEVFLAHDSSLDRKVALKFLPDIFSGDPERLARFEREAKLLASLNHPNIATIYGLEQADGKRFLAMELVEGETLAQQIERGPLTVNEALEVCRQIAEGLEAAHEKGVIHRDLKPANIKITPEGKVKILDFGLAKAFQGESSAADASKSPTLTNQMTQAGVILGTAAYMAPEQAKGRVVDKRADSWAFGCILYECLTGKRPFNGDTITETLASIIKTEPDWDALPTETPESIRRLLRRCLHKDQGLRLRDIGDARIEIGDSADHPFKAAPAQRRFSVLWPAVGAALMLVAGILIDRLLTGHSSIPLSSSVVTSTIKVEPGLWLDGMRRDTEMERPSRTAMAISHDGRFVVYSAIEENPGPEARARLFMHRMDQPQATPIPGTEGGINPFLSPDDGWVGFWADRQLKKVSVEGGVPKILCNTSPQIFGASWGRNNSIVFSNGWTTGLSIVSTDGGDPKPLTNPDPKRHEGSHRLPSWLPDGKALLFTIMKNVFDRQPRLALYRTDTGKWEELSPDGADAKYISTGHLIFLSQATLMAVRFDPVNLKVIGQPSPLLKNIMQAYSDDAGLHTGAGQFAVSDAGSLIYAAGGITPDEKRSLVWVDQSGKELPVTARQMDYTQPRLSPDFQRIAYATDGRDSRVWVYDIGRDGINAVTEMARPFWPVWSSDGKQLIFGWFDPVVQNIFSRPFDGSVAMGRLTTSTNAQCPGSLWKDGKTLAIVEIRQDGNFDIALLDTGIGRVTPLLNSQYDEKFPEFSPDGRWIAYTSNKTGRQEVYVQDFPKMNSLEKVSSEGGIEPVWARDGKRLYYRWPDELPNQMWVVDIQTDGSFAAGKPHLLFQQSGYLWSAPIRAYDIDRNSQRFLMVKREQRKPTPVTEMTLVQNWFEDLKRRVPVK